MDKLVKPLYQPLYDAIQAGRAILTAGRVHPDIPVIQDVGHALPTDGEVRHIGFGCFLANVGGEDISFDGGGAMTREEQDGKWVYSWTYLTGSREALLAMGYPWDEVRVAVDELMAQ
jgi:hypothetical protein